MSNNFVEVSLEEMIQGLTGQWKKVNTNNIHGLENNELKLELLNFFNVEDEEAISEQIMRNIKLSFAPKFSEFQKNEIRSFLKTGYFGNYELGINEFYDLLTQTGFPNKIKIHKIDLSPENVSDCEQEVGTSYDRIGLNEHM